MWDAHSGRANSLLLLKLFNRACGIIYLSHQRRPEHAERHDQNQGGHQISQRHRLDMGDAETGSHCQRAYESCQEGWHRPTLSLFAKVSLGFSYTLPKVAYSQKFAFAQCNGAMKAPVGLLSDRTVLRSKMEGPRPDKFTLTRLDFCGNLSQQLNITYFYIFVQTLRG